MPPTSFQILVRCSIGSLRTTHLCATLRSHRRLLLLLRLSMHLSLRRRLFLPHHNGHQVHGYFLAIQFLPGWLPLRNVSIHTLLNPLLNLQWLLVVSIPGHSRSLLLVRLRCMTFGTFSRPCLTDPSAAPSLLRSVHRLRLPCRLFHVAVYVHARWYKLALKHRLRLPCRLFHAAVYAHTS